MGARNSIGRPVALMIGALLAAGAGACGDPESNDQREFYTKAPLEDPGLFVRGEPTTELSGIGEPIRRPPESTMPAFVEPLQPRTAPARPAEDAEESAVTAEEGGA